MIHKLTVQDILHILKSSPEQAHFDWKLELNWTKDDDKKSEIIKDIAAISNSIDNAPGYIFYGVNPESADPIIGLTNQFDDGMFQQLINGKIDPVPSFLYYEIPFNDKRVGVVQIAPGLKPYIISRDFGKLRNGQLLIRVGSSTRGMTSQELRQLFIADNSPYVGHIIKRHGLYTQELLARSAFAQQCRNAANDAERTINRIAGIQPSD